MTPKISITRIYTFAAAHQLVGLRKGHKCARLHGHNYRLEVTVAPLDGCTLPPICSAESGQFDAPPPTPGMVVDAGDIDGILAPILAKIDHYPLHDLPGERYAWEPMISQPTAENIALWLWNRLQLLSNGGRYRMTRLVLWENDRLFAEVTE